MLVTLFKQREENPKYYSALLGNEGENNYIKSLLDLMPWFLHCYSHGFAHTWEDLFLHHDAIFSYIATPDCCHWYGEGVVPMFRDIPSHVPVLDLELTSSYTEYYCSETPQGQAVNTLGKYLIDHNIPFGVIGNNRSDFCEWRNKIMAIYIPSHNILFATDISHNSSCISMVRHYLPKIKRFIQENFGIDIAAVNPKPMPKKEKTPCVITLGADPEFEIIEGNTVGTPNRLPGIEEIARETDRMIGLDGSMGPLEIRPERDTDPAKLADKIYDLLHKAEEKLGVTMSIAGHKYPLGSHVHIGFDKGEYRIDKNYRGLSQVFDAFFGVPLVPLSGDARVKQKYAKLTAWESKNYGFEYRSLPSIVFANKTFYTLILKGMKHIADTFVKEEKIEFPENPAAKDYETFCGFSAAETKFFFRVIDILKGMKDRTAIHIAESNKHVTKKANIITFNIFSHWFPSLKETIINTINNTVSNAEINCIISNRNITNVEFPARIQKAFSCKLIKANPYSIILPKTFDARRITSHLENIAKGIANHLINHEIGVRK